MKAECLICGKPVSVKFAPFCSDRCAQIDLGRWLGEDYRIPAPAPDFQDDGEGGEN